MAGASANDKDPRAQVALTLAVLAVIGLLSGAGTWAAAFSPTTGNARLLGHRVRDVEARTGTFALVTRGDADTGVERWTMPAADTLGTVVRLPGTGYMLAGLSSPALRSGLLIAAGLLGASVALRRIWAR